MKVNKIAFSFLFLIFVQIDNIFCGYIPSLEQQWARYSTSTSTPSTTNTQNLNPSTTTTTISNTKNLPSSNSRQSSDYLIISDPVTGRRFLISREKFWQFLNGNENGLSYYGHNNPNSNRVKRSSKKLDDLDTAAQTVYSYPSRPQLRSPYYPYSSPQASPFDRSGYPRYIGAGFPPAAVAASSKRPEIEITPSDLLSLIQELKQRQEEGNSKDKGSVKGKNKSKDEDVVLIGQIQQSPALPFGPQHPGNGLLLLKGGCSAKNKDNKNDDDEDQEDDDDEEEEKEKTKKKSKGRKKPKSKKDKKSKKMKKPKSSEEMEEEPASDEKEADEEEEDEEEEKPSSTTAKPKRKTTTMKSAGKKKKTTTTTEAPEEDEEAKSQEDPPEDENEEDA